MSLAVVPLLVVGLCYQASWSDVASLLSNTEEIDRGEERNDDLLWGSGRALAHLSGHDAFGFGGYAIYAFYAFYPSTEIYGLENP